MKKFSVIIICAILPTINVFASNPYFWSHEADSNGKISTADGGWELIDAGGQGAIGHSQVGGTAWDLGAGYVYTLQDIEAPAQITDLTAETGLQIKLSWTAPGDDGNSGTAKGYILKYSQVPIDKNNFGSATIYPQSWQPSLAGTEEIKTLTGFIPRTTYYFCLQTYDEYQKSKISNSDAAQTGTYIDSGITIEALRMSELALGDYDRDGYMDFAIAGVNSDSTRDSKIYHYNSVSQTYEDIGASIQDVGHPALAWGDYDSDGDLDLALCGDPGSGGITKLYRNDNGTFIDTEKNFVGVYLGSIAWGDYDNDGDLDFALCGSDTSSSYVTKIYKNELSSFTDSGINIDGFSTGKLAWGDYDNDGDLDLAICGSMVHGSGQRVTRVYKNESGTFSDSEIPFQGVSWGDIIWGDYDNDGNIDLFLSGDTGSGYITKVYKNNGDETFSVVSELTGIRYADLSLGDYDNDGNLDLALCGNDTGVHKIIKLFLNKGAQFEEDNLQVFPGIDQGDVKFGDFDDDGDLDFFLTGGTATNSGCYSKIYLNLEGDFGNINNAPSSPDVENNLYASYTDEVLTLTWDLNNYDAKTSTGGLYFNIRISTYQNYDDGKNIISGVYGSPLMGNYLRPKITDETLGVRINNIKEGSTYYWSVQTIDTGLRKSNWPNNTASFYPMFPPSQVTNLEAFPGVSEGEIKLSWTAPGDDGTYGTASLYDIRWSSISVISTSTWVISTQINNEPVPLISGTTQQMTISGLGLIAGVTYYFAMETFDEAGNGSLLSNSTGTYAQYDLILPSSITDLVASQGSQTGEQIKLSWTAPGDDGKTGTVVNYILKYATFNITAENFPSAETYSQSWTPLGSGVKEQKVLSGLYPSTTNYFAIKAVDNGGNGSLSNTDDAFTKIFYLGYMDFPNLKSEFVAWGDYDNDRDLDLAVCGYYLNAWITRIYRNDITSFVNTGFSLVGVQVGALAWGDYDNDGDLDIALCGDNGGDITKIYRNGSTSFTDLEEDLEGVSGGSLAWGDYDNDGDLDLAVCGPSLTKLYQNNISSFTDTGETFDAAEEIIWGDYNGDGDLDLAVCGGNTQRMKLYKNIDGSFAEDTNQNLPGIMHGEIAWGDYDNDGDLDLAVCGLSASGGITELYKNNEGILTKDTNQNLKGSLEYTSIAFGDYNNDGNLDLFICGLEQGGGDKISIVYQNRDGKFYESERIAGFWVGKVAWSDYNNDRDLDLAICGDIGMNNEVTRIYLNSCNYSDVLNSTPIAPSSNFKLNNSTSTISLTWDPPDDNDETPVDGLYYNIRVGTCPSKTQGEFGFDNIVAGQYGSPLLGNYLRPRISSATLGVRLNLERDATYYWSVQTIDAGLRASAWSTEQHFELFAPSLITNLSALTGGSGEVNLTWTAPGDDGLTGSADSYVVKHSTAAIDTETKFNTATNYSNSWTPQVAGSTETHTVDGLTAGVTYFFAIKSKDDYDNISNLSNSAFACAGSGGGQGAPRAPINPFELGEVYSFPNPAKRYNPCLHIEVGFADSIEVKIYNIAGELVYKTELAGNPLMIGNKYAYEYVWDTSGIASGVYIYLVRARRTGFNEIKVMKKMAVIK